MTEAGCEDLASELRSRMSPHWVARPKVKASSLSSNVSRLLEVSSGAVTTTDDHFFPTCCLDTGSFSLDWTVLGAALRVTGVVSSPENDLDESKFLEASRRVRWAAVVAWREVKRVWCEEFETRIREVLNDEDEFRLVRESVVGGVSLAELKGRLCLECASLERALSCLVENPPRVLRELLERPQLAEAIGEDRVFLLKVLVGPPIGLNIRNVAWHGFLSPDECPPELCLFLCAVTRDIRSLVPHAQQAPRQPPTSPCLPAVADRSALLRLLTDSFFVIGGREESCVEGLEALSRGSVPLGLALLLPELEHCLRRLYVVCNDLPSSMMSPNFRVYYTTLDIILQQDVVLLNGLQLLAVSSDNGARYAFPKFSDDDSEHQQLSDEESSAVEKRPNRLREVLGDGPMMALQDLFVHSKGPRLRNRVSHGELQGFSQEDLSTLVDVFLFLCGKWAPEGMLESVSPGLVGRAQAYTAKSHPVAMAVARATCAASALAAFKAELHSFFDQPSDDDDSLQEYRSHRGAYSAATSGSAEALAQLSRHRARLTGDRLDMVYCSSDALSVATVGQQVVLKVEQVVAALLTSFRGSRQKVSDGSAVKRTQASFYKLCGCADHIVEALSGLIDLVLISLHSSTTAAATPLILKAARCALMAVEKCHNKLGELAWDDCICLLESFLLSSSLRKLLLHLL